MKKKEYKSYGIDVENEYRTYKNVGKGYEKEQKNLEQGKKKNKKCEQNKKYAVCNKYSEWETHVRGIIPTQCYD